MRLPPPVAVLGVFLYVVLLVLVGLQSVSPPKAVAYDAPPKWFSYARVLEHVRAIAGASHPMVSPENARVRDYLVPLGFAQGLRAPTVCVSV